MLLKELKAVEKGTINGQKEGNKYVNFIAIILIKKRLFKKGKIILLLAMSCLKHDLRELLFAKHQILHLNLLKFITVIVKCIHLNMKEYESKELTSRVDNAKRYQGSIPIIQEYETILRRQIRNTFIIAYRQGCIFKTIRGSNGFLEKVEKKNRNNQIDYKLLNKFSVTFRQVSKFENAFIIVTFYERLRKGHK